MHVVHISVGSLPAVFTQWGGAIQRRVGELATAQARRGHTVTVFSPNRTSFSTDVNDVHMHYLACRVPGPASHIEYQAKAVGSLLRERDRIDVIHFHSEPEGAVLSAALDAPRVLSYDNFLFRRGGGFGLFRVYRRALGRFDALLPCSQYCADESSDYWRLEHKRMHVVHNGVNLRQFKPDAPDTDQERERRTPPRPRQ